MKIHWRIESSNARHTRLTLFIDGMNCGQLCLASEDTIAFLMIQRHGKNDTLDSYNETGHFTEEKYARERDQMKKEAGR